MATLEYSSIVFIPEAESGTLETAVTTAFDTLDIPDVKVYLEGQGERTKELDSGKEVDGTQFRFRLRKYTDTQKVESDLADMANALVEIGLEEDTQTATENISL
ncbi:hypothetical protein [Halorubrum tailed virus BLv36]|nr:hypothetical protein [Halorubrum tailed virus BLv36]